MHDQADSQRRIRERAVRMVFEHERTLVAVGNDQLDRLGGIRMRRRHYQPVRRIPRVGDCCVQARSGMCYAR